MSELNIQNEIARKYSERFNHKYGQLFHVPNERNSKIQAYRARAIGIMPGVSDYIYFDLRQGEVFLLGIEVKAPGAYHLKSHIERQLSWARTFEKNGGTWRLVTDSEQALSCIEGELKGHTIAEVEQMLLLDDKKSMRF